MNKPNYTISIIDIDSMFYQSSNKETLESCIITFKEKLQNCLEKTQCTHWIGFTSKGKTFRNSIFDKYKANRTQDPPKYLLALKEWAIIEYGLFVCKGYEADDAVAYFMNTDICVSEDRFETREGWESVNCILAEDNNPLIEYESVQKVMCAVDKDLLKSIYCKNGHAHFNYTYLLPNKERPETLIKGWWIETTEAESDNFRRMQMIVGDSSDGVGALKGKGIKYWEKLSKDVIPSWGKILQLYIVDYGVDQGIFEFQKNKRLLHLLDCDQDFIREIGETPMFPNVNKVIIPETGDITTVVDTDKF